MPASSGSDSVLAGGRPVEGVEELVEWAKEKVGLPDGAAWRLIGARTKLRKILFEVEETSPDGVRRLVGKVAHSTRSQQTFATLQKLWDAGFRPPSQFTVPQPIAWLPERTMLLVEKAPGAMLHDSIRRKSPAAPLEAQRGAYWLAALHDSGIPAGEWNGALAVIDRCERELTEHLPGHRLRLRTIAECLRAQISETRPLVPSHGDYHPMNIFLHESGRITVIDLDTFSMRERAADVGYFLAQTMIMGWLELGSFESTAAVRAAFADAYTRAAGSLPQRGRIALYRSLAFLQSLHFERCILHTGNESIVEPWLDQAESCCERRGPIG